jgi:hypothetical protein
VNYGKNENIPFSFLRLAIGRTCFLPSLAYGDAEGGWVKIGHAKLRVGSLLLLILRKLRRLAA